jgi:hypothetical protein
MTAVVHASRGTLAERRPAHTGCGFEIPTFKEPTMTRHANILETIGNTPLVRLNKLAPPGVHVHVKLESFNPLGSVKDRMARAVIEHAERTGALAPGQTVIEATSGNTGIGLAMVCAQKGSCSRWPRASAWSGADCCAFWARGWCSHLRPRRPPAC